jgi:hypothetical protein
VARCHPHILAGGSLATPLFYFIFLINLYFFYSDGHVSPSYRFDVTLT